MTLMMNSNEYKIRIEVFEKPVPEGRIYSKNWSMYEPMV